MTLYCVNMYICYAPSSDLPGLKTGLPHLPTKPQSEDGVPVLRPGCPIFRPQVLPQLLTCPNFWPSNIICNYFVYFKKLEYKYKFYSLKSYSLLLKAQIIQIQKHTHTHKYLHIYIRHKILSLKIFCCSHFCFWSILLFSHLLPGWQWSEHEICDLIQEHCAFPLTFASV